MCYRHLFTGLTVFYSLGPFSLTLGSSHKRLAVLCNMRWEYHFIVTSHSLSILTKIFNVISPVLNSYPFPLDVSLLNKGDN